MVQALRGHHSSCQDQAVTRAHRFLRERLSEHPAQSCLWCPLNGSGLVLSRILRRWQDSDLRWPQPLMR